MCIEKDIVLPELDLYFWMVIEETSIGPVKWLIVKVAVQS